MNTDVTIRVLGPVDVSTADGIVRIGSRHVRATLASLVIGTGRAATIDVIRDTIWPDDQPLDADGSIHTYVSRLRHLLGPGSVERTDHSYRLVVSRAQIDAALFEDRVGEASSIRHEPQLCSDRCAEALSLWRGDPFGDIGDMEPFRLEAGRLEELRLVATELALDADIALGRHELAAAELESAVRAHPFRENLWYLLADALHRDGRRIEALRACHDLRAVLADAGLEPRDELVRLEQRIAAGPSQR